MTYNMLKDTPQRTAFLAMQEDRCAPRSKVEIPARLRISGRPAFGVTVRDLSLAGFSCDFPSAVPVGSRCWLKLPLIESLEAEVMWNDGMHLGCAFSNLLSPIVLDMLLREFGQE